MPTTVALGRVHLQRFVEHVRDIRGVEWIAFECAVEKGAASTELGGHHNASVAHVLAAVDKFVWHEVEALPNRREQENIGCKP